MSWPYSRKESALLQRLSLASYIPELRGKTCRRDVDSAGIIGIRGLLY